MCFLVFESIWKISGGDRPPNTPGNKEMRRMATGGLNRSDTVSQAPALENSGYLLPTQDAIAENYFFWFVLFNGSKWLRLRCLLPSRPLSKLEFGPQCFRFVVMVQAAPFVFCGWKLPCWNLRDLPGVGRLAWQAHWPRREDLATALVWDEKEKQWTKMTWTYHKIRLHG